MELIDNVDCVIADQGIDYILKDAEENLDSIERAWTAYLAGPVFERFKGRELTF